MKISKKFPNLSEEKYFAAAGHLVRQGILIFIKNFF